MQCKAGPWYVFAFGSMHFLQRDVKVQGELPERQLIRIVMRVCGDACWEIMRLFWECVFLEEKAGCSDSWAWEVFATPAGSLLFVFGDLAVQKLALQCYQVKWIRFVTF
jgi:hypothetical protein